MCDEVELLKLELRCWLYVLRLRTIPSFEKWQDMCPSEHTANIINSIQDACASTAFLLRNTNHIRSLELMRDILRELEKKRPLISDF